MRTFPTERRHGIGDPLALLVDVQERRVHLERGELLLAHVELLGDERAERLLVGVVFAEEVAHEHGVRAVLLETADLRRIGHAE